MRKILDTTGVEDPRGSHNAALRIGFTVADNDPGHLALVRRIGAERPAKLGIMVHTNERRGFDQGVIAQLIAAFEQEDDLADPMAFRVVGFRCLIPGFDGAVFSQEWKDALWDKFYTGAPRRQRRSVEQYKIVKRA